MQEDTTQNADENTANKNTVKDSRERPLNPNILVKPNGMPFTPREKKFLSAYLETGSLTEAAIAYGTQAKNRIYAGIIGHNIFKRLGVSMAALLDNAGVDDQYLTNVLKEGLKATRVDFVKDGDTDIKRMCETPDFATRHRYLDTAAKIKKHITNNGVSIGVETDEEYPTSITFTIRRPEAKISE
jgi:hypothetical protein